MRRRSIYALVYGGSALVSAVFGIAWWVSQGDPLLGGFFLILAVLSVGTYFLATQPMRLRAERDAERKAASATPGMQPPRSGDSAGREVQSALGEPRDFGTESGDILVERPKGFYYARFRRYRILIDGEAVGSVRKGATLRATVTAGPHTVVAKIDWSGSPSVQVDVPPGGHVALDVEPSGDPLAGAFSTDRALTLTVKP